MSDILSLDEFNSYKPHPQNFTFLFSTDPRNIIFSGVHLYNQFLARSEFMVILYIGYYSLKVTVIDLKILEFLGKVKSRINLKCGGLRACTKRKFVS